MPIVKRNPSNDETIEFKIEATLSNGIQGKIIFINNLETHYIITKDGRVFNTNSERELKPFITNLCKYKSVRIPLGKIGKKRLYKTLLIHRLIALAYIQNPDKKPIINHLDGNKHNNSLNNLEWCTYSENNIHAIETGLRKNFKRKSEDSYFCKHNKKDVVLVCECLQNGESPGSIAKKYGFGKDFIYKIRRKEAWKEIASNYTFPTVKKFSNIFTLKEIEEMKKLFEKGYTVREVIYLMNWEYDEKLRGNVKYQKFKWKEEKSHQ